MQKTANDEPTDDRYFDDRRPHSPPTASGGAYYPPYPTNTPPGFTNYPNPSADYQGYVPQDYVSYPPPQPPGPPPATASDAAGGYPPPPPGPPPPGPPGPPPPGPPPTGGRIPPDHVSDTTQSLSSDGQEEGAFGRTLKAFSGDTEPETNSLLDGLRSEVSSRAAPKSVVFIPLSPKSSMTMERHRKKQRKLAKEAEAKQKEDDEEMSDFDLGSALAVFMPEARHKRSSSASSDPSHDSRIRRHKRNSSGDVSSSDDDTEILPDRFDSHGRPVGSGADNHHRWTSRRGDFESKPRRKGDWDVKGAWQVAGTDQQMIDNLVRNVTGVLEGRQNWMGLLGAFLGGLEDKTRQRGIEDDQGGRQRKFRRHEG